MSYNILGLQLDTWACGHYRLRYPLLTLKRAGHDVMVMMAGNPKFDISRHDLEQYSHIICQRQINPHTLQHLLEWRHRTNGVLLYEVDDNLHRVHPQSHAYKVFKPGGQILKIVDQWIKNVDGLIVTTPDLAAAYTHLTNRIWVLNNYLDLHIRDWDTPVPRPEQLEGKLVIGWAGGSTHTDDDEPLRGVLPQILMDYDDVVFALCSHPGLMQLFIRRLGLPPEKCVTLQPVDFELYPRVPAMFDIGVAPLRDTGFNRNKSALKIMEYGARGVPYVASDIAPYRRFHLETNGVGGFLAEGKTDWDVALRTLIEQPKVRERHAKDIYETVRRDYSLVGNIGKWEDVLTQSLDRSRVSTWMNTEKPGRNDRCPCGSEKKYKRCCYPAFG